MSPESLSIVFSALKKRLKHRFFLGNIVAWWKRMCVGVQNVKIGGWINSFNGSCHIYSVWNIWCLSGVSSLLHNACLRHWQWCSHDSSEGGHGCSFLGFLDLCKSSMPSTSLLAGTLPLWICCTRLRRVRREVIEGLCTIAEGYS